MYFDFRTIDVRSNGNIFWKYISEILVGIQAQINNNDNDNDNNDNNNNNE